MSLSTALDEMQCFSRGSKIRQSPCLRATANPASIERGLGKKKGGGVADIRALTREAEVCEDLCCRFVAKLRIANGYNRINAILVDMGWKVHIFPKRDIGKNCSFAVCPVLGPSCETGNLHFIHDVLVCLYVVRIQMSGHNLFGLCDDAVQFGTLFGGKFVVVF